MPLSTQAQMFLQARAKGRARLQARQATRRGYGARALLGQVQRAGEQARTANLKRYQEAMAIYDKIIARSRPGGAFERRGLAEIGRARVRGVGQETQQLISSGLYGTTTMAGAGRRWEAEVGAPARGRLEDIMEQRVTAAQQAKAGFIERREDVYPDVSAYAQYAGAAAAQPRTTTRTYGGTYGASSFPDMFAIPGEAGAASTAAPTAAPTAVYGAGTYEATMAERQRRRQAATELYASAPRTAPTTTAPTTTTEVPTSLAVGTQMGSMLGKSIGSVTIKGVDTTGWTEAERKAWRNYVPGVSGYNVAAMKKQQRG